MARIVILSVLVLAALCHVYGAQQESGYGPLLREVRKVLFKGRNSQVRSETHYWCWEVLEKNRESICNGPPPTKPPLPAAAAEFVGAREAKGFFRKDFAELHEECCFEGCDVEEVDESC